MLAIVLFVLLLVVSCFGDARVPQNSQDLSQGQNDVSFKVAYQEAIEDFQSLTHSMAGSAICNHYEKEEIRVTFYSKSHPLGTETAKYANYDRTKPFKIIVHQKHDGECEFTDLLAAYLRHHDEAVNVFTICYPRFFGCDVDQYVRIHNLVTETIFHLITSLHANGVSLDKVHIIGLGFSAHVAGSVAKILRPLKVGRITGLDPLGAAFDRNQRLGSLGAEDADFVDVISTNSRKFGTKKFRGIAQFYPNGGEIQPETDDFGSHVKAKDYFVESITRTHVFESKRAPSWMEYNFSDFGLGEKSTYMGENVSNGASGKYFLGVNAAFPFSQRGEHKQEVSSPHLSSFLFEMPQSRLSSFEETQNALKQ